MTQRASKHGLIHCGLPDLCDICGQYLKFEDPEFVDPSVALAGDKHSSGFQVGFISPFRTEVTSRNRQPRIVLIDGWRLCRRIEPFCQADYGVSEPGCAVHRVCLELFMRHCTADDALDRLWQTCVWRRVPWTGPRVPKLRLAPRSDWHFTDAFVRCAERCGLRALDTLPQVVIGTMLQFMPRDHYVWRCIAALDLAQRLSVSPSEPWKTVELSQVVSWERGTPPEIATREAVGSLPSLLRLTLDLDGLKKVERLTERPQFSRRRFDNEAFVLEQEDQLGATTIAHFKNGLLRFSMPGSLEEPGLAFWDTPTPPDPAQCLVRPYRLNSRFRFHTIDLSAVTGLTFFLYSGRMMGIHGHTRSRPCALATYSTIRGLDEMDEFCSWVYVPVAPRDAILRCGSLVDRDFATTGNNTNDGYVHFLIRTRLSGETLVGRYGICDSSDDTRDFLFLLGPPEQPPTTLIYSKGSSSSHVGASVIATYDGQGKIGTLTEPLYYPSPDYRAGFEHSYAPLENVSQIHVFYCLAGTHCMGMLFDYDNGGQRAVGQCRLFVVRSTTHPRPSSLAWEEVPSSTYNRAGRFPDCHCYKPLHIRFDSPEDAVGNNNLKWSHYAMAGTLEFWLFESFAAISIKGGTKISPEDHSDRESMPEVSTDV